MCYDHVANILSKSRVGELLKRNKMSRVELAKLIDASPQTIRAIERGNYDPPLSIAYKLAAALDVSVERLFSDGADVVTAGSARASDCVSFAKSYVRAEG